MLKFCRGGVLTGYNGAAYLKCSLSHTKGKSAVGQKYFLIVSPALCFTLLARWIHSAFLEKTWIYSEADLEWSFSPLEITENPSMLTKESLPSIILPLYFLLFLILLFSFMFLLCFNISQILGFLYFLLLFSFGYASAAWQPSGHSTRILDSAHGQEMSPFHVRHFP